MTDALPYIYRWNRQDRKGQPCEVPARGRVLGAVEKTRQIRRTPWNSRTARSNAFHFEPQRINTLPISGPTLVHGLSEADDDHHDDHQQFSSPVDNLLTSPPLCLIYPTGEREHIENEGCGLRVGEAACPKNVNTRRTPPGLG